MDSTRLFVILVFGIPAIGFLSLAIKIFLHMRGIKKSSNEFIIKRCSTSKGRNRAKKEILLFFICFLLSVMVMINGLING